MGKTCLFLSLLFLTQTLAAQQVDMKLFSTPDKFFKNPVLIGKVGSHYMVMDEQGKWPTIIYTFDSSFQLVNTTPEYISTHDINFTVSDNTLNIIWRTWARDTLNVSIAKLDEHGNKKWFNSNKFYFPGNYASTPLLVTDAMRRYFLYYSLSEDGSGHDHIRAVLMDSNWTEIKTLSHLFNYDNKQFTIASPLVDGEGNIYMAVYDKLSNYHLSATVTIHKFPLASDTALAKSFQFEKVKFHEFDFTEDLNRRSVKLTGFYYDGQLKEKNGITELIFSNKGNELAASRFYEFPPGLADELRANLVYGRKQDNPTENLRLKDIFVKEGSLFVSAWLVDVPSYQLAKDKDVDKEDPDEEKRKKRHQQEANRTELTNPSVDGWLNNSKNFNTSSTPASTTPNPGNPGVLQPAGYVPVFTSPVGYGPVSTSSPYANSGEDNKQDKAYRLYGQTMSSRRLVYFSIDTMGRYKYQVVPNNRFYGPGPINLNNYPLVYDGHLLFLNNNAQTDGTKGKLPVKNKTVSVLKYGKAAKPANTLAVFGIDDFYILSKPAEIAEGTYLSVFRKSPLVESGLVVWKISEK